MTLLKQEGRMKLLTVLATLWVGWCAGAGQTSGGTALRSHVPAYMILGKTNGEIWRCFIDAPTTCELLYRGGTYIMDTLVHGDHLYVAHGKQILKCDWYGNGDCASFNSFQHWVWVLSVTGGFLQAKVGDKDIYRCELFKPRSCSKVHTFEEKFYGLYHNDQSFYVGKGTELLQCSKDFGSSCQPVATIDDTIVAVAGGGDMFMFSLKNQIWAHNLTTNKFLYSKKSLPNKAYYLFLEFFQDNMYTIQITGNIIKCKMDEASNCAIFVKHENARSISFTYAAHHMQNSFLDGTSSCRRQSSLATVFNYAAEHRVMLEVSVADGLLVDARGELVDTRRADVGYSGRVAVFAMGLDGQLLVSYAHGSLVHITSLFAGRPVAGAGEIVVHDGVVLRIVACSEEYQADVQLNRQVVQALYKLGYARVREIRLEEFEYTCDRD